MPTPLLTKLSARQKRADLPAFRPGDTIRVHVKIKEGDKERLASFRRHGDCPQEFWSRRNRHGT